MLLRWVLFLSKIRHHRLDQHTWMQHKFQFNYASSPHAKSFTLIYFLCVSIPENIFNSLVDGDGNVCNPRDGTGDDGQQQHLFDLYAATNYLLLEDDSPWTSFIYDDPLSSYHDTHDRHLTLTNNTRSFVRCFVHSFINICSNHPLGISSIPSTEYRQTVSQSSV